MKESRSHYEKKFSEELLRLNAEQRRAVERIDGPVMVIAGPGTGKTQIIAARIGYILKSDIQIAPHNILCLTYTDAGTVAMRNRLLQFIGPTAYRVNIYTFHAFCNDIIQHNLDYFGKREMEPISELETVQLLREMLDALPPTHSLKRLKGEIYYDVPRIKDLFRTMKEEDWTPEHVSVQIDKYLDDLPMRDEFTYKKTNSKTGTKAGDVKHKDINAQKEKMELLRATAQLFPRYCSMMKERGRYDYSDMILWVLNAFKQDKDFLSNYQEWYQYFLIDEYQDTSGAQNELLQLLIDYWEKPNVFVVGDDDQCIYEFQGARVKNMTQFFERFAGIEVVVLKENYRSTQKILDASKAVIDNNVQRLINQEPVLKKIPNLSKTLIASHPDRSGAQHQPKLIQYYNVQHEEAGVVEQISALQESLGDTGGLSDIAIIYFKHTQASNIIDLLEKKGIPYNVKKKTDILNLTVIQQLLNILCYLKEEHDRPHSGQYLLFEMMHYRFFSISPKDIAKIAAHCGHEHKQWRDYLANYDELKKLNLENYGAVIFFEENLTRWISEVSNSTLQLLFEKVLNWSGLLKHILASADKVWLLQVVTTLFDFIKSESAKHPLFNIRQFLEMIQQMREAKIALSLNKTVYQENGVNLITAHSAKGLEFRYVFLIGCTSDNWEKSRGMTNKFSLPDTLTSTQKDDENKLESARRLFYVGMTRAKEYLQISFAESSNNGKALEHSIYVEEIKAKTGITIEKRHLSAEKISAYTALALAESPPVNSELLDREYTKSILEKFSMSVTHLNKYLQCPLTFYYESILRVPFAKNEYTAFGTAVHNVLKWLFDGIKDRSGTFPSAAEFIAEFKKQMKRQRDAFTEQEFDNRVAYGEQTLPDYYNKYVSVWNKNVKTEFTVNNIEIEGVPVNGNLDKIEFGENNECNVVDYKTGKPENGLKKIEPPPTSPEAGEHERAGIPISGGQKVSTVGGDYWRQIVFYKILVDNFKRENWKMLSGEIDFVEKHSGKKDFVKAKILVTKEDVAIVKKQIKETYAKILNHEFTVGCGEGDCKWCNFVKGNSTSIS
jgi:DNA helicase II / ATP-dependent DNA helicase PcrA